MFVVDLYLTFSYFVSFVRAYCSESLVRLMSMSRASCNSFNACVGPCVTGYVLALLFVSLPVVIFTSLVLLYSLRRRNKNSELSH